MATRLKDIAKLSNDFWNNMGVVAMTLIRKRTQKGIDRNGNAFPAYKASYATKKAKEFKNVQVSFRDRSGRGVNFTAKERPKKLRGISLERQISPPQFELTRRTMRDLNIIAVSTTGVSIGWRKNAAFIIRAHEERGKYKVGGMHPKGLDKLTKLLDKEISKRFNDARAVNINVRF